MLTYKKIFTLTKKTINKVGVGQKSVDVGHVYHEERSKKRNTLRNRDKGCS